MGFEFALTTLEQGLVFGIMALGVYITFRILNFADLSVDGSFPLGAAVAAQLIISGYNPFIATLLSIVAGGMAGAITGFLNTRLKITPLLAGILTMTSLYSINLRIMGRPNIPLLRAKTIFTMVENLGIDGRWVFLILFIIMVLLTKFALDTFLKTQMGFVLRASGDNPQMVRSVGVDTDLMKFVGLVLSNSLVSFSGALVAQYQGFADVGMGIGTIIAGLASVIIGEVLVGERSLSITTFGVILGSIIYRFSISIALNLGFRASDLKLLTAILVIIALSTPKVKKLVKGSLGS